MKVQVRHPITGERLTGRAKHTPQESKLSYEPRVWDVRLDNGTRLRLTEFEARAYQLIVLDRKEGTATRKAPSRRGTGNP